MAADPNRADPPPPPSWAAWDAYVRKVVAAVPPLRPEQIAALSALFDWKPDTAAHEAGDVVTHATAK